MAPNITHNFPVNYRKIKEQRKSRIVYLYFFSVADIVNCANSLETAPKSKSFPIEHGQ